MGRSEKMSGVLLHNTTAQDTREQPLNVSFENDEFPLPEEVPTASEEKFSMLKKRDATAEKFALLMETRVSHGGHRIGDSYEAPQQESIIASASEGTAKKKGRTVAFTTEDMQKKRNDVKARTTLLLALPDEHQLRFSKYKTAQELWAAILKTFSGNEATKKTKKNLLKHQYGNFKAEGLETLEKTFNRLQAIVSHLEFIDIEIEQDDLNQKSDHDIMSLDDLFNHLKVYELDVQKKSELNSQNMSFISSAKNSSGNEEVNTASIPTTSTQVFPARPNSFMANEEEYHALVADEEAPTEFSLMAKSSSDNKTGLPEFADDTITDYNRPSPTIESNLDDLQNKNPSFNETGASSSTILSKPAIKFVKAAERPTEIKTNKVETVKKPAVKYAEMYRKTSKSSNVRGNQRKWNTLKSQQLGKNFLMKNKACYNCGCFDHLSYDCGKWVDQGKSWAKNNYTHKSRSPRTVFHKSGRPPMRTNRPNMNAARPKRTSFYKPAHSYVKKPFQRRSALRTQYHVTSVPKKYEHNTNFHQIVDFVEASHLRYALTINPTVYVSHIRQFWSTASIETMDEGTKILATIDGKPRTISESSIRRNLKLKDEAGINSLPDAELFENFTLMGYNILPNQMFSFQQGQFSHQWKYLIHTIMHCLSPKSTGFNEFSSNIATAFVYLATNRVYNFLKMIFD
nr:hypothetical protein [Tanacetum cinerariifolium]